MTIWVMGLLAAIMFARVVNTILVHCHDNWRYEEGRCGATPIKPGHLIEVTSADLLQPQATAGKRRERAVAIEDAFSGGAGGMPGIVPGGTVTYTSGGLVRYVLLDPGEVVYLILKAGQTVNEGGYVTSNGDGCVKTSNGTTDENVAMATQALDLTVGGSVDSFLRCRMM